MSRRIESGGELPQHRASGSFGSNAGQDIPRLYGVRDVSDNEVSERTQRSPVRALEYGPRGPRVIAPEAGSTNTTIAEPTDVFPEPTVTQPNDVSEPAIQGDIPGDAPSRQISEEEFVERFQASSKGLYRKGLGILHNTEDAADLVQETFALAWRARTSFSSGTSFDSWVGKICSNAGISQIRRADRRPKSTLGDPMEIIEAKGISAPEPSGATDIEYGAKLEEDLIESGVHPLYAQAVVHVDILGLPLKEAAESLGVPLGTVQSRVHRGRQKVRAYIEKRDIKEED